MTWCPCPTFHAPPTLSKFYVESRNKVHFSAAVISGRMIPCIVVVLDTLQPCSIIWCPWPTFHAPLTLSKFYVESRNKVQISVVSVTIIAIVNVAAVVRVAADKALYDSADVFINYMQIMLLWVHL